MDLFDIKTTLTSLPLSDIVLASLALPTALSLGFFIRYIIDSHNIRLNGIPGPLLARFSDIWLGWIAAHGHRSEIVHALHEKYGKFVRIAPNHVSINSNEAIHTIYAHGAGGGLKSDYYDAFLAVAPSIFSTRSKAEHTRKRKMVAHIFSQKSVAECEPYIQSQVEKLFQQWDVIYEKGIKELTRQDGGGWGVKESSRRVWFDCLPWYNYLTLDIITELAFGSPFGFLEKARDTISTSTDQKTNMSVYARETRRAPVDEVSARSILNMRGEYPASLGVFPPWCRPIITTFIPWYSRGKKSVNSVIKVAITAISERLLNPTGRDGLFNSLKEARDDGEKPIGFEELIAEALTYVVAGTDTTTNAICIITYYLALHPSVQTKLQEELDQALGPLDEDPFLNPSIPVSYNQVKNLRYLEAILNETMRLFSFSGIGLPRVVPKGGMVVLGKYFPEGTVLSVPTYSLHRDKEVWGEDVESFRPERWLERDSSALLKSFNPFSFGPRSCIGRNLAVVELRVIIASIFRRYDFILEKPDLDVSEGFLRKASACRVGIRRRGGSSS